MKRYAVFFIAALWLVLPSPSLAIEGFPGSTWGDIHFESAHPGDDDLVLDGWARQGIGWARLDLGAEAELMLDTYVTARYYIDTEGFDWYNYFGPGGGLALEMYAPDGPAISAGAEFIYQMNFKSGTQRPYVAPYLNWYHWWDLHGKDFPGSTWGDLRWELPTNGEDDDLILEGWIRQGVVLKRWETEKRDFILYPYIRARYKVDSRGLDWNNYAGPGAGIAFDMESPDGPLFSLGAEYGWERRWRSNDDVNRVEVYLRWYTWWDLKK